MNGHLEAEAGQQRVSASDRNRSAQPRYYTLAFSVTTLLATGGYMLMPFGSAYTVNNLGIDIVHLPTIYLVSGLFSIVIGPLVGRASDAIGKFPTFAFGSALSIAMVLIYTHLGHVSHGHADDGHRGQCADVRRHLLAHDPVAGADFGHSRAEPARRVQRGRRLAVATVLRRASARCWPPRSSRKMPTARSGTSIVLGYMRGRQRRWSR